MNAGNPANVDNARPDSGWRCGAGVIADARCNEPLE
jgi:hypothetical protein